MPESVALSLATLSSVSVHPGPTHTGHVHPRSCPDGSCAPWITSAMGQLHWFEFALRPASPASASGSPQRPRADRPSQPPMTGHASLTNVMDGRVAFGVMFATPRLHQNFHCKVVGLVDYKHRAALPLHFGLRLFFF